MRLVARPVLLRRVPFVLALGAAVSACAASPPDGQAVLRGYGTPSVSSYVRDGRDGSVQAELDRCSRVAPPAAAGQTQGLAAACDQLRRTARNQPGNAVQPSQAH